jgi:tetratricopeptide (TPR) repeat protein
LLFALFFTGVCAPLIFAQETPPDALARYRSGREAETRGQLADANNAYNDAVRICIAEIESGKVTMDSYTVLTWALQRQKKYNDVIRWGQQAMRINADNRIIETMGEAYFYLDNYTESLRNLERYVNNLPQGDRTPTAYFFIGEIYRLQKRLHYSDIAYTTAVRLESGMSLWWYRLGTVREELGDKSAAAEAFERAIRINPSYTEASQGLARVRKPA